jgi:hypothetical protein
LTATTPTGTWLGQDGHDLVGPSSTVAPSDVQDIHVALADLPAKSITFAKVGGYGGGEWDYQGNYGPFAAAIVRSGLASTADMYLEPYQVETGRQFQIDLTYSDSTTQTLWFNGGAADPNLRMPNAALAVGWIGQDGHDGVGLGPAVGPDGIQDARLTLARLSSGIGIETITIDGPAGASWTYGTNPQGQNSADLDRDTADPTKADLYINPDRNLNGQTLTVTVVYANGKSDVSTVVAGATNPALAMPAPPAPPLLRAGLSGQWIGQDGGNLVASGDVHVTLAGIPAGRTVIAAMVSDVAGGSWAWRGAGGSSAYVDPLVSPLAFRPTGNGSTGDLYFPPIRDESGTSLTARLTFDDGSIALATVTGGTADIGRRSPNVPAATSVVAHPGDDLNSLANRYGTVRLAAGDYNLSAPLILTKPVTIIGDPGAQLIFTQPASDPAWTAAIKINAGHTTLSGFAVRFAASVRWNWNVSYGPAVIGTTDEYDPGTFDPRAGIVITGLDLQTSPAATSWEEAPRMIRLITATSGQVSGNTLNGGTVVAANGPWTIDGNTFLGTPANTYSHAAVYLNNSHDVTIQNNTAHPLNGGGKLWRFLVQSNRGAFDVVANNTIIGVGPMDSDTVPDPNAPEIMLTENYTVHFEGTPSAISGDGRILQITAPQAGAAWSGDMVAILTGPQAGTWRRIVSVVDPTTYIVDSPLPSGSYAVSLVMGFFQETYSGNTVDMRGSSSATGMVVGGNHFGITVADNHFIGGRNSFKVAANPTNNPDPWGWTHTPCFGATIDGNTVEDALGGGLVDVEHSLAIQSTKGRVYFSGSLDNTNVVWSAGFLAAHPNPPGLVIGDVGSLDPAELQLTMTGNRLTAPPNAPAASALQVHAGDVNGVEYVDSRQPLSTASSWTALGTPSSVRLVNDTGFAPNDTLTYDARLTFAAVPGASGYEYRVNDSQTYTNIGTSLIFAPSGLAQGTNTVWIRAYNASGTRGTAVSTGIRFDSVLPTTAAPSLAPGNDSGWSNLDNLTNIASPSFTIAADPSDVSTLYRDGVAVAHRTGTGTLRDSGVPGDGSYTYTISREDTAGLISHSASLVVTIDTTAPAAVQNIVRGSDGTVSFWATSPTDLYLAKIVGLTGFFGLGSATSFVPAGPGTVVVHAMDRAGNIGPDTSSDFLSGPAPIPVAPAPRPQPSPVASGVWLGQDGRDLVSLNGVRADGLQDVHIAINGLRTDVAVASVQIGGLARGNWFYSGSGDRSNAAWSQAPGASSADLYLTPNRPQATRSLHIVITYADGGTADFNVAGGTARPRLAMPRVRPARHLPLPRNSPSVWVRTPLFTWRMR